MILTGDFFAGIFDGFADFSARFPKTLLNSSSDLFAPAFVLKSRIAGQAANFFFSFALDLFALAFDLVFVFHFSCPSENRPKALKF
ncbi:MAG TPA: hypothetical protein VLH87_03370 [Pyrinomonadaceae bacterium]|nr:hypothetical protein [Pyrinomonadaceae bacterium]